jgi:hypothetical protein
MAEKKKKWIQKAVPESHKGIFTAKAERAGKGVQEYAREKQDAPGALGKQARLALTFAKMGHKRKRSPLHSHPRSP